MTKQSLWNRGLAALDEWLALGRATGNLPRAVAIAASLEPSRETQIERRNVLNFVRWRNRLQAYRAGFPPQPKDSARADCAALGIDIRRDAS
jgi:hypothetical protein